MEEIGATNPEYQPLRVNGTHLCTHAQKTIPLALIHRFTTPKVPSLYQQSSIWSWLISMAQVFCAYLIKALLPSTIFLCMRCFFFVSFSSHTFSWGSGSLREPQKYFFKLSFYAFTLFSNNSLISWWISAKLVSAFLPSILYLSYYFQPEVSTWMYLRKAITLQTYSCHNLNPLKWFA